MRFLLLALILFNAPLVMASDWSASTETADEATSVFDDYDPNDPFGENKGKPNCAELAKGLAKTPSIVEAIADRRNGDFISVAAIDGNEIITKQIDKFISVGCDDSAVQAAIDATPKKSGLFSLF